MFDAAQLGLSPYYLNTRRLEVVGATQTSAAAQRPLINNSDERVDAMRDARRVARRLLQSGAFPHITAKIASSARAGARLLGVTWDVFTFRGVAPAYTRARHGKRDQPGAFSAKLALGEAIYSASDLDHHHYYSDTSMSVLSGRKRMLVAGIFEFRGEEVGIEPYIIGELVRETGAFAIGFAGEVRVYPAQIDAFRSPLERAKPATKRDLDVLLTMPESEVKKALAEIIGEPFVPKDWGGENSDLQKRTASPSPENPFRQLSFSKGPRCAARCTRVISASAATNSCARSMNTQTSLLFSIAARSPTRLCVRPKRSRMIHAIRVGVAFWMARTPPSFLELMGKLG